MEREPELEQEGGGSERLAGCPRPRRVLVPRGSRSQSASSLEAGQKATSWGLIWLCQGQDEVFGSGSLSGKLLIKEERATPSASSSLHKQLTCKGI